MAYFMHSSFIEDATHRVSSVAHRDSSFFLKRQPFPSLHMCRRGALKRVVGTEGFGLEKPGVGFANVIAHCL